MLTSVVVQFTVELYLGVRLHPQGRPGTENPRAQGPEVLNKFSATNEALNYRGGLLQLISKLQELFQPGLSSTGLRPHNEVHTGVS